jgi:hypothetical protein
MMAACAAMQGADGPRPRGHGDDRELAVTRGRSDEEQEAANQTLLIKKIFYEAF